MADDRYPRLAIAAVDFSATNGLDGYWKCVTQIRRLGSSWAKAPKRVSFGMDLVNLPDELLDALSVAQTCKELLEYGEEPTLF